MSQIPEVHRADSGPGRDRVSRASSILLGVLSVEIAVLVVTGIALWFLYRPTAHQAWTDVLTESYDWDVGIGLGLRLVHRLASGFAVFTALAVGIVLALRRREQARRWGATALGAGIAVTTLAASFTGFLLPWDQLALWSVTVGSNIRGYSILFGPTVRFAIVGGVEVSPETLILWLLVHSLLLGPALVGLVVFAWRRAR
ncbi:MAG TPA: cytochrome b N-terminal domain-containing protein [Acidimicrobiales bacterium]|nr:cytochrome b N-terminal domain-containing protein [Acidimicrobiales bacterium]